MKTLAIIIPAYKITFLHRTLESIAQQTNHNFSVYIGDDNSPYDIKGVVEDFQNKISIKYHRFQQNKGTYSLVEQWRRCVELSMDEDYIWLFSDDDVLADDAVERFWQFEEKHRGKFDICRFQIDFIDRNGVHMLTWGRHPQWQTAWDFIRERMFSRTLSAASEYIFTRKVYVDCGFVEFPVAWCADDASWAQMGRRRGIFTIDGAPVQMRMSGDNISSSEFQKEKRFEAVCLFVNWVQKELNMDEQAIYQFIRSQIRLLHIPLRCRIGLLNTVSINILYKVCLVVDCLIPYKLIDRYYKITS